MIYCLWYGAAQLPPLPEVTTKVVAAEVSHYSVNSLADFRSCIEVKMDVYSYAILSSGKTCCVRIQNSHLWEDIRRRRLVDLYNNSQEIIHD